MPSKIIIVILFIVYFGLSVWGASHLKTGLKLESVIPESSFVSDYYQVKNLYFTNQGAYIMFVIKQKVDYSEPAVQKEIHKAILKAKKTGYVNEKFEKSWLKEYLRYVRNKNISGPKFVEILKSRFLKVYPEFKNDIVFTSDEKHIRASRIYLESKRFDDSTHEGNMMTRMRQIAGNSSVPMLTYSPDFIYYEHYVSIMKNTLLAVGVAAIGMLFVALVFIPHPIAITCVTITMGTIVLGMFGLMNFWDLALSAITTVQIILSVGFCVDFTVHISHAFMTATGKNRNERVQAALEKVGVPIINGAISSILGILMLAFAVLIFTSLSSKQCFWL